MYINFYIFRAYLFFDLRKRIDVLKVFYKYINSLRIYMKNLWEKKRISILTNFKFNIFLFMLFITYITLQIKIFLVLYLRNWSVGRKKYRISKKNSGRKMFQSSSIVFDGYYLRWIIRWTIFLVTQKTFYLKWIFVF